MKALLLKEMFYRDLNKEYALGSMYKRLGYTHAYTACRTFA